MGDLRVSLESQPEFPKLIELIRTVKPSLAGETITPGDMLIETLGFDSLDVTQLARSVRRQINRDFDQDEWLEGAKRHKLSIDSLLSALATATAA